MSGCGNKTKGPNVVRKVKLSNSEMWGQEVKQLKNQESSFEKLLSRRPAQSALSNSIFV